MRKITLSFANRQRAVLAMLLVVCSLMMTMRANAANLDFTLKNRTGQTIRELYISPHTEDKWGEDVLGADVLEDGEETAISFDPAEEAEVWDLKVVISDTQSITWENLTLTEITKVTLRWIDGEATAVTE